MRYSPERKEAVLKKMTPPNNRTIKQLSEEEGISEAIRQSNPDRQQYLADTRLQRQSRCPRVH